MSHSEATTMNPRPVSQNNRTGGQSGVASIEFALLSSFLVILYMGFVEVSFFMESGRRITRAASTVSDLSGRYEQLDDQVLDEIHHAARLVILPEEASSARIRLTSFSIQNDEPTVDWSVACNWMPRQTDTVVEDIPMAIWPEFGSALVTEMEIDVEAFFGFLVSVERTLTTRAYGRPREASHVVLLATDYVCPYETSLGSLLN
jgi:Flp pilus assembly protein TadG